MLRHIKATLVALAVLVAGLTGAVVTAEEAGAASFVLAGPTLIDWKLDNIGSTACYKELWTTDAAYPAVTARRAFCNSYPNGNPNVHKTTLDFWIPAYGCSFSDIYMVAGTPGVPAAHAWLYIPVIAKSDVCVHQGAGGWANSKGVSGGDAYTPDSCNFFAATDNGGVAYMPDSATKYHVFAQNTPVTGAKSTVCGNPSWQNQQLRFGIYGWNGS